MSALSAVEVTAFFGKKLDGWNNENHQNGERTSPV